MGTGYIMKNIARSTLVILLLACAVFLTGCEILFPDTRDGGGAGQTGDAGAPRTNVEQDGFLFQKRLVSVAGKTTPSVVNVKVTVSGQGQPGPVEGVGSGVIYRSDGYILTNAHVVEQADQVLVALANGQDVRAQVIGADTFSDIAVIKIPRSGLPAARFGSARKLEVGQIVLAIGSPLGFQHSVSMGIVSALNRSVPEGGPALSNVVQTDAPISPGNSGGALVDLNGRVIGVNTAFIPPAANAVSIGFAIPIDTAKRVADQLIKTGKARHPFIGIEQVSLTRETAAQFRISRTSGVLVVSVLPGSPAAKAGLKRGDLIVEFDGEEIEATEDLFAALGAHQPGDTVELTVVRGRDELKIKVTLTERAPNQ